MHPLAQRLDPLNKAQASPVQARAAHQQQQAQQAKRGKDGKTPPPGYYRAPNSTMGSYTDGKGNYWRPGEGVSSGGVASEQGGAGETKVDTSSPQEKRQSASQALSDKHAQEADNKDLTAGVRAAHREAHEAHRRAIAQPTNRRLSREAFMATNRAREKVRGS